MSVKDFELDLDDFEALEKLFKRSRGLFVRAAVGTVNNLAFSQRQEYINQIDESMNIRNQRFVSRQMAVTKAKTRDLDSIQAVAGSVQTSRFSGWAEQERGEPAKNNRMITTFGRVKADDSRQAKGPARAKTTNKFAKISDYTIRANSRRHRLIIFLQMMIKEKKTFVMPRKYKGLKRGVYFATAKKLRRVQTFGNRKVRKNQWMNRANQKIDQREIERNWEKTLNYLLPNKLN